MKGVEFSSPYSSMVGPGSSATLALSVNTGLRGRRAGLNWHQLPAKHPSRISSLSLLSLPFFHAPGENKNIIFRGNRGWFCDPSAFFIQKINLYYFYDRKLLSN